MCELLHTRAKKAQVVGADRQAALRDLRLEIKSESLERVMHDTPFGSSLESPGPPGAFFNSASRLLRRQLVGQLGPFALDYLAHLVRDNADVLNLKHVFMKAL